MHTDHTVMVQFLEIIYKIDNSSNRLHKALATLADAEYDEWLKVVEVRDNTWYNHRHDLCI